jgi:hypothetical protein
MEEALKVQLLPEGERKTPDKEVLRYRDAVLWGFQALGRLPISPGLILGIQKQQEPEGVLPAPA